MKLSDLPAYAAKNKPLLIGAGAAVAVGAGLYARKTGGPGTASTGGAGTPAGTALPYSVGGQSYPMSGAGGVYDSSASDLYGAVAPQLEGLSGQLTDLRNKLNGATPIPVPTPVAAPLPPITPGFYAGGANYYQVYADGSADQLTAEEHTALGNPALYQIAQDSPFWSRLHLIGNDPGQELGYRARPAGAPPAQVLPWPT